MIPFDNLAELEASAPQIRQALHRRSPVTKQVFWSAIEVLQLYDDWNQPLLLSEIIDNIWFPSVHSRGPAFRVFQARLVGTLFTPVPGQTVRYQLNANIQSELEGVISPQTGIATLVTPPETNDRRSSRKEGSNEVLLALDMDASPLNSRLGFATVAQKPAPGVPSQSALNEIPTRNRRRTQSSSAHTRTWSDTSIYSKTNLRKWQQLSQIDLAIVKLTKTPEYADKPWKAIGARYDMPTEFKNRIAKKPHRNGFFTAQVNPAAVALAKALDLDLYSPAPNRG